MHEKLVKLVNKQTIWDLDECIQELKIKYDNDKYYYDEVEARNFYKFTTKLEVDKGKKGQKIKLIKFQFEICTSIICVKRKSDGLRRFRQALVDIPRKNGKSFIIALIATYLYYCKNEFGSETIITANSSSQAALLFNTIHHMIKNNKTLKKHVRVVESRKHIYKKNMNAYLRVLSSDASNADSYAGFICIIDEIHEAKNRKLYDKLITGMGIWDEPLMLTPTTASSGDNPENLEFELYNYAKSIESGEFEDDSFFYAVFEAKDKCDLMDEEEWFSSNPALGTFRKYDDLKSLALRATRLKTQEAAFRRLYLNQHVALDGEGAINMELWDGCTDKVELKNLKGMKSWDALDMSATQDITAYVKVFYDDDRDKYIVYPMLFTPKETLFDRSEKDNIRYDVHVENRELIALEGRSINYRRLEERITDIDNEYDFDTEEVAFDRWGSIGISGALAERYDVMPFGQGYSSMSPAIRTFENLLLDERLIIADNKLLRRMAANVVAKMDPAGNIKYDKSKSKYKIDGIIALIMALSRAVYNNEGDQYSTEESVNDFLEQFGGDND